MSQHPLSWDAGQGWLPTLQSQGGTAFKDDWQNHFVVINLFIPFYAYLYHGDGYTDNTCLFR